MSNIPQASKVTWQSVVDRLLGKIPNDLLVAQPARIISYNAELQTSTIQLLFIKTIPTYTQIPILKPSTISNVPVVQNCGANGGIIVPVNNGDEGSVLFLDRSKDNWQKGQGASVPNDARVHHQTDAVFIPFLHSTPNALKNTDNNSTIVRYQVPNNNTVNNQIKLKETQTQMAIQDNNGTFIIKNGQISFSQSTIDTFNNLITTLNDVKSALTATSNKTLQVPAGALAAPNGPVSGSTTTQTPDLTSNINTITQDIQNLQDSFNNGFKKLFTD